MANAAGPFQKQNQNQNQKPFTVFTWNMQGNLKDDKKFEQLMKLIQPGVIGCIQEGGVKKGGTIDIGDQGDKLYIYEGKNCGAFNERCTHYVISTTAGKPWEMLQKNGGVVIAGGDAGRAPAAISINGILFVSWHSIAAQDNLDTASLLQGIEARPEYKKFHTIAIGGDFNSSPQDIEGLLKRNIFKWNYQVLSSGKDTHKSGKELDFFIVLSQKDVTAKCLGVKELKVSDHNPVFMTLEY